MRKRHHKKSKYVFGLNKTALAVSCAALFSFGSHPRADKLTQSLPPLVFTQIPIQQAATSNNPPDVNLHPVVPAHARIVVLPKHGTSSSPKVLTRGFYAACDPCVSFDGTTILFAGKKSAKESWNIWEVSRDGSSRRRITRDFGDCREPIYLPRSSITAPEFTDKVRWIAFSSTHDDRGGQSESRPATSLYVTNIEPIEGRGTVVWCVTYNLGNDYSPTALRDGRILFSSNRPYQSAHAIDTTALMAINWAGTGLNLLYGNHQGARVKTMACELDNRSIVFVESDRRNRLGGRLARVWLRRPLRSHEIIGPDSAGHYCTPHRLTGSDMLVSWCGHSRGNFGIFRWNPDQDSAPKQVFDDPAWHDIDAMPLVERPEPHGRIPIVEDDKPTGHLQCLNVYESDKPGAQSIRPGTVASVRFIEGIAVSYHQPEHTLEQRMARAGIQEMVRYRILGQAPVEKDGSFYVEVPGDVPFCIQTLDTAGMAVQTMRSWMWVRRGSRRGCIGCHENKELAPENKATTALIKARPPALHLDEYKRTTVDFQHDILPLLQRHCTPCHTGVMPRGSLNLGDKPLFDYNEAYVNLLQLRKKAFSGDATRYVQPWHSRESRLILYLQGKGGADATLLMPPDTALPWYERRIVATWIDIGAGWNNRLNDEQPTGFDLRERN